MRALLDGLGGLKRRFLFALLQIRTASAALSLGDIRSFNELIAGSAPGFSDPTGLTRWTKGFLYAGLVGLIAEWSTQTLMVTDGTVRPSEAVGFFWMLRMVVMFGTMLLVPAWTLRANHNARQLGASAMTFAPVWAAGWYFLPPGLFWKPYQVMQEIWRASVEPSDWRSRPGTPLVGWWWGMWLLSAWVGVLLSLVATLTLEASDAAAAENAIRILRTVGQVSSALILLTIISRVHRMQMAHYREAMR